MVDLTHEDMVRLRKLITDHSGLGGFLQSDQVLERAITLRLAANHLDDLSVYWSLLERPRSQEMASLVQLVTNKETFFFREMHHFDVLRDRILPELLAARKFQARPDRLQDLSGVEETGPLRLWSAGCSTGEEAYSLAIILLEYQKRFGRMEAEIIGTDLDPNALETARWGQYSERSIRLVPAHLLRQYFTFDGQTFRINPQAARMVRFQLHNLAADRFPPELGNMDVIFCRNVTTYFEPPARDRLNRRLAASLRDGGYLFVASTETMSHNQGELELFPVGKTFYFRKRPSAATPISSMVPVAAGARENDPPAMPMNASPDTTPHGDWRPSSAPSRSLGGTDKVAPPETWLYRARMALENQDYDAALSALDRLSTAEPVVLETYSLRASALIQKGELDEAEAACQYLLAFNPWDVDAHFLMGLISFRQGELEAAVQSLKTAVYFQPEHRWAHFYLAQAYQAMNLQDKARREYRYTLNILRARQMSRQAPDLNLSGLDDEALRQICEANLDQPA